ncbi:MAG: glycosyltransferase family 2 protein [Nitrospiraceae bacterium]|nr:glycosyltransferase family 2 protein [Nitrospiraceae bacterium]
MSKLSVYVIAYNDEPNMKACLESVAGWGDELIVVDSHSTDRTAVISREYTDKVYQVNFTGFGDLRNQAVALTTHEWVFSLDSDERMTPELKREIQLLLDRGPGKDAYFVPRKNYFLGRWIKHCGWYPDYRQPQLFRKSRFRYREELVHESFDCDGPVGFLKRPALQYPFRDIDHYVAKQDRYSDLMARRMVEQGRKFSFHQMLTHPLGSVFKMYVLRAGFLDGMPGLILSGLYAYYTFMKYAKFWESSLAAKVRGETVRS